MSEITAARPRRGRPVVSPGPVTADSPASLILAVNVRRLREERDWTQDDLAGKTGIARKRISLLETKAQGRTLATVDRLARALEVTAAELLTPPAEAADQ